MFFSKNNATFKLVLISIIISGLALNTLESGSTDNSIVSSVNKYRMQHGKVYSCILVFKQFVIRNVAEFHAKRTSNSREDSNILFLQIPEFLVTYFQCRPHGKLYSIKFKRLYSTIDGILDSYINEPSAEPDNSPCPPSQQVKKEISYLDKNLLMRCDIYTYNLRFIGFVTNNLLQFRGKRSVNSIQGSNSIYLFYKNSTGLNPYSLVENKLYSVKFRFSCKTGEGRLISIF